MENDKQGFIGFAGNMGKKAKEITASAAKAIKAGGETAIDKFGQYRTEQELKKMKPVFRDDLLADRFSMPPRIRIVDYDRRKESGVCANAIGFEDCIGNTKILTFYSEILAELPIRFYPNAVAGVYSVCPQDSGLYINLTEYFTYLKNERLVELRDIARSLGAKHFRVVMKESNSSSDSVKSSKQTGIHLFKKGTGFQSGTGNSNSRTESNGVTLADDLTFAESQEPIKPKLKYYKNDNNIQQLIEMRLNKDKRGTLTTQNYCLHCSATSCIDNETAKNLGVALKKLDYSMVDSFVSQAYAENQSVFEYTIEF